jgi:Domain of unknown function (DUF4288)
MNWYIAKLVFRIISGIGNHMPQFDEQLRLINAADEEEAFEKALQIGREEQDSFVNHKHERVQWSFINVPELNKLPSLTDGAEIYSRVSEHENAKGYIDMVNNKAGKMGSAFFKKLSEAV